MGKSEHSWCPCVARAVHQQHSLAKPRENKGCCPLATGAQLERASEERRVPSLRFLGFSHLARGAWLPVPWSMCLGLGPPNGGLGRRSGARLRLGKTQEKEGASPWPPTPIRPSCCLAKPSLALAVNWRQHPWKSGYRGRHREGVW